MYRGFFRVRADEVPDSMRIAVSGEELAKWPLMHGSWRQSEEIEPIRTAGLRSANDCGVFTNTDVCNQILGRSDFVYLAPASLSCQYGAGYHALLIDPGVLSSETMRCSECDINYVVECIRITMSSKLGYCGGNVKEQAKLEQLVRSVTPPPEHRRPSDEKVLDIMRLPAFREYYDRHFALPHKQLFRRIEATGAELGGFSLFDYFNRNGTWPLHEEIAVPSHVEPCMVLGHWDCGRWIEWRMSPHHETQRRVDEFVAVMEVVRVPR